MVRSYVRREPVTLWPSRLCMLQELAIVVLAAGWARSSSSNNDITHFGMDRRYRWNRHYYLWYPDDRSLLEAGLVVRPPG
jgi:hypothetical protein